jgi:dTDP-4-amino-4,6-dideoxygalactose transaminase
MTADHGRLWPWWSDHALAQAATALGRGEAYTIDSHPAIDRLETGFAERHGARFGMFCASGTAALAAAYFALGLSPGAEVLAPTNTFRATVTPLLALGYRPVLCDADTHGNVDLADAARRIRPETEGVVVTHLNGHPVDLDAARRFAEDHGLALPTQLRSRSPRR